MYPKVGKNPGEASDINVEIPSPLDHTNKGTKSNYDATQKKDSTSTSKYAKFDKGKRERVIYLCEVIIFFLGIASCVASLTIPHLKQTSFRGIEMWQWCLLVTALLGGPMLSKSISYFIVFCIDREFSAKENIIYYVAGLVESAWVVLWFGMILLAWTWVVDEPSYLGIPEQKQGTILRKFAKTEHIITLTLITILLGSFLWLIKDLFIMIMKSSFHVRRFFDRIMESLGHEYRIKALTSGGSSSRKVLVFKRGKNVCCKEKGREIDLISLKSVDHDTVSCWTMKILIEEIIKGRPLVYMDDAHVEMEIDDEEKAIKAAETIFSNLSPTVGAQDHSNQTGNIDSALAKCLHNDQNEVNEVKRWLLEGGQKDKEVFKKCVIRAWKFRTRLIRALEDNKQLFRQLSIFVDAALVIIIFVLWLVFLNAEVRKAMVLLGSFIVGSAFIFGDFSKKLLDDFTFVFVAHPFDAGDCCLIGGAPLIIEKINLLTTKVSTLDEEMKYYPNSVLCDLAIINYTRSPPYLGDKVVFFLDIGMGKRQVDSLKGKIKSYIGRNSRYWRPEHELVTEFDSEDSGNKIKATLLVKHTTNYYEYQQRQDRKSKLVLELEKYLEEVRREPNPSQAAPSLHPA